MGLLRIVQGKVAENRYRVTVAVEGDGQARQTAESEFAFELTQTDHERIRWYLEDYLQYPHDPAPTIAAGVEKQIEEIGTGLFNKVFGARGALMLWARIQDKLNDTRVEIATTVEGAAEIPWELMRDPDTGAVLSLRSPAFVRSHSQPAQVTHVPEESHGAIRILLVICRPGGRKDVPFRSVASRLIKGLKKDDRELFQLDVLRPATFERLGEVLREAKATGKPYHVVHFDGHGMYAETPEPGKIAEWLKRLGGLMFSGAREGSHGYLLFENSGAKKNVELIDGPALGNLLVETDVSVLVLNACRSAHADIRTEPKTGTAGEEDPHAKVRALGSLAQEVMDAGVAGVVAMRYNVYVVTAADLVANLYGALSRGWTLGEAVTLGRKQLKADPLREIAYEPRALQDWCVPVVYEAAAIRLFPRREDEGELKIELKGIGEAAKAEMGLDEGLPRTPDAGFFGRDETLLALDRAFDECSVVLLHAYAGSGKTAAAAEFARWYSLTGGLGGGPVLFTTFERHAPLRSVLGHFGEVFGATLEKAGVNWSALTDTKEMRDIALQVFKQVPVLWIWDNVEPVNGFPAGTKSAWSKAERQELVDFLRDARETKAKFLLTSRRDEKEWLGDDLPRRIEVPAMPMQERVQLARGLAERQGKALAEVEDWLTLLEFTQGNPLTITVLVGQALRDGLKSAEEIAEFVEKLRKGEGKFRDEKKEGRSKSLGASLDYGFGNAFSEEEQKKLALLHFFQGFVDVDALKLMGREGKDWGLAELRSLTKETGIELLDRAAEIGLLTAHGGGYYRIHPALPWFFKELFHRYYPGGGEREARAFVEAMGELGNYYHREYAHGKHEVIGALKAEEGNLLYARQLAMENEWWDAVMSTMQGLNQLYDHTGRRGEWRRLVEEIVPEFVDAKTDGPLPGREDKWGVVTQYRVRIAGQERQWSEAERLQRVDIEWDRKRAEAAMAKPAEELDGGEQNRIRSLVVALHDLAQIQREQGKSECVGAYKESLELAERIGEKASAATCAFNIGHAHKDIDELRDLEQAEEWYKRSLELQDKEDRQGRAHCLGQLGHVVWERFQDARKAQRPKEELAGYLNEAAGRYDEVLEMLPEDAVGDLAVTHTVFANIYAEAGEIEKAMEHYRESIRYYEIEGNLYGAGQPRYNVATTLSRTGRFVDALEYAKAALANFESYGDGARADIERTQRLIAKIEKLKKKSNKESME